jgi:hypothetical protein
MLIRLLGKASHVPVDAFALTPALSPYRGEGDVDLQGKTPSPAWRDGTSAALAVAWSRTERAGVRARRG